jgi:plasmid stabilization system protein ParE
MRFTVIWRPDALDELANAWTEAANRNAVTEASERIDQLLTNDPMDAGESRFGKNRIVFEPPLAVIFRVNEGDRMVFVLSVGTYGRPA